MARKKNNPRKQKQIREVDLSLPQNIVAFGGQVKENKRIYISQNTYKEIHRFTRDKTTNESGGVLLGNTIEEFGKTHIIIRAFIEAKYCEGTPTTLKFTHESWEYIHKESERKYPQYKILGWIHTHPDFGIFLSEYDMFIQENFFREENQIAYVVDPIQNIEGFYFWINGKIERCEGFFIFDRTGVKITVGQETEELPEERSSGSGGTRFFVQNVIIALMAACILLLGYFCFSLNRKITNLQKQDVSIVEQVNANFGQVTETFIIHEGWINNLMRRVQDIEDAITPPEATTEPEVSVPGNNTIKDLLPDHLPGGEKDPDHPEEESETEGQDSDHPEEESETEGQDSDHPEEEPQISPEPADDEMISPPEELPDDNHPEAGVQNG